MVPRFIYSLFLLCLLLLAFDHGDAVKNLKEKHFSSNIHKNCDEQEGKSSSSSSYIEQLEKKYNTGYDVNEVDEESSSPLSYIASLENKYKSGYVVEEAEEKSSLADETEEKITEAESRYKPVYGVPEADQRISRLESSYKPGYIQEEAEEKIALLESRYKPGYVVDETEEKIAHLENKYKPGYNGPDEIEEKSSSASSYIARLEIKYKPGYNGPDEIEEKIARLESKYKPGYVMDEAKQRIAQLERRYKADYGVGETNDKIARLDSKYKPSYGVDDIEEKRSSPLSSNMMEHHTMDNHGDDDIGSEDVGVFTVDDVVSFQAGRRLSTFFSIRKHYLYPGFLPREIADSIPFSSSEALKILQFFSISLDSSRGKAIRDTLRHCEIKPVRGETKTCATSSESMLEFLKNAFGKADFKLISTSHPTMKTPILQSYTVLGAPREIKSPRKVACHPMPYLYAVYMCHYDTTETKIFKVPLVGDNGDKVDALIVCHMDTSAWSPAHTAFSLLGTKPGIPACHAFTEGHGVWIESSGPVAAM